MKTNLERQSEFSWGPNNLTLIIQSYHMAPSLSHNVGYCHTMWVQVSQLSLSFQVMSPAQALVPLLITEGAAA